MLFEMILLFIVICHYFYTMSVVPKTPRPTRPYRSFWAETINRLLFGNYDRHWEQATEALLPPKTYTWGTVIRALLCVYPFLLLSSHRILPFNLLVSSFILVTLISPLMLHADDLAEEGGENRVILGNWLSGQLNTCIKTLITGFLFSLLSRLPIFPSEAQQQGWLKHLYFGTRPDHEVLNLPLWFYLLCVIFIVIKAMLLTGVKQKNKDDIRFLLCPLDALFSGTVVLIYFYNLTGHIRLTSDNWQAPVAGGFLAALAAQAWQFLVAFISTKLDTSDSQLRKQDLHRQDEFTLRPPGVDNNQ